jgi:hypothetical protein
MPPLILLGAASFDNPVILGMSTNPYPDHIGAVLDSHGSIMQSNSRRPQRADFLEMEGRMVRVIANAFITAVGQTPDFFRQPVVTHDQKRGEAR